MSGADRDRDRGVRHPRCCPLPHCAYGTQPPPSAPPCEDCDILDGLREAYGAIHYDEAFGFSPPGAK